MYLVGLKVTHIDGENASPFLLEKVFSLRWFCGMITAPGETEAGSAEEHPARNNQVTLYGGLTQRPAQQTTGSSNMASRF